MQFIDKDFSNEIVTVVGHGFSLSSKKKTPYFWALFSFDNVKALDGAELHAQVELYFTDAALDYTLVKLKALGWTSTDVTELDPNEKTAVDFKGRKCRITGKYVPNTQGEGGRPVVNFVNDLNYSPGNAPAPKGTAKELSLKLSDKLKALRSAPKASAAVDHDDIPF